MTKVLMNGSDCTATLRRLDQYMDDALDASAAAALLHHLEACPSCYQELELRRQLRSRLKAAVNAEMAPPHLATRVLANVRAAAEQPSAWTMWRTRIAAVTTVLAVALGLGIAYELGHLRFTTAAQDSYI